ncbi:sensor histidine kinase [Hyphomicrobium sp. 2TAF46]|uniref:sensor histidine kinase n=1 Tax=Hyphomicrobium sp. 2TAF46 TaxID=3233019 RepID=UPI003F915A49
MEKFDSVQRAITNDSHPKTGERTAKTSLAGAPLRAVSRFWERRGLPTKLIILTAAFVLLAEALIFLPSIASYRVTWLQERLTAAQLAALTSDAFPGGQIPSALRADLLRTAQVRAIASRTEGERRMVFPPEGDLNIDYVYYLPPEPDNFWDSLTTRLQQAKDAVTTLLSSDRTIRVIGHSGPDNTNLIEIVIPEAPLKAAMIRYGMNILWLSIILSLLTAVVVYFALSRLFVKPLTRITSNMLHFAENPEDQSRIMPDTGRSDEIGVAERELASMQRQLASLLAQKNRLAQLGMAVSKINHDLRNMLANAQLISDRLVDLPDPTVQRFVPKLIASLDRAIQFCNSSLQFGGVSEAAPRRELMRLKPLLEEVADSQGLPREGSVAFVNDMDASLRIDADREHLFRVLSNLIRNAVQAIESVEGKTDGEVRVAAHREGRKVIIDVMDNGAGIPQKARENLFKAFQASTKKGGTGLGLVIAAELVQAHGGTLTLVDSKKGAHFRIELPDRPVD